MNLDLEALPSPAYLIDAARLDTNLERLQAVKFASDCKILLALKGYAVAETFPLIRQYLDGCCAGALHEARLAHEEFGGELHLYSPAIVPSEAEAFMQNGHHVDFNSNAQWDAYAPRAAELGLKLGMRCNPEYSEVATELYNPCCAGSRLGVLASEFAQHRYPGISGLHFHTHCGQYQDTLERTLNHIDDKFGRWLPDMEWINLGGGQRITADDYDRTKLVQLLQQVRSAYGVQVYLEPGEAVVYDAGYLLTTVLDVVQRDKPTVILDTSASAHMPDVIEMPYRPDVVGAGFPGIGEWTCRLTGSTCLAGDVIGEYSFPKPLVAGDRILLTDMAHYTVVKNTTFNGLNLPALVQIDTRDDSWSILRQFGYDDYRARL